ncbi:hypothetical protein [Weissella minor]|uniref:hypothetical protein n=1 Tax=Weissella minor TaxID=1620 RepID=UPI003AF2C185
MKFSSAMVSGIISGVSLFISFCVAWFTLSEPGRYRKSVKKLIKYAASEIVSESDKASKNLGNWTLVD